MRNKKVELQTLIHVVSEAIRNSCKQLEASNKAHPLTIGRATATLHLNIGEIKRLSDQYQTVMVNTKKKHNLTLMIQYQQGEITVSQSIGD